MQSATAERQTFGSDTRLTKIEPQKPASDLEDFVYIVSHDLRNSARALTEVPQWLRDDMREQGIKLSDDIRDNFELLERHARRLDRMLLDLLVFSRVGRMQEVTDVDLSAVVAQVITESTVPDNVAIDVTDPLPRIAMGHQDAYVLVKALVDNVARHCAGADVSLSIAGERVGEAACLSFIDTGPGIAPEHLQRAFRPMATLKRRDEVEGSGMGLATVHRIVALHDGDVWAGPGPDGTGFAVRVFLKDAPLCQSE